MDRDHQDQNSIWSKNWSEFEVAKKGYTPPKFNIEPENGGSQ